MIRGVYHLHGKSGWNGRLVMVQWMYSALHVLNLGLLEASIYLETTTVAQGNHLSNGEDKHLH